MENTWYKHDGKRTTNKRMTTITRTQVTTIVVVGRAIVVTYDITKETSEKHSKRKKKNTSTTNAEHIKSYHV